MKTWKSCAFMGILAIIVFAFIGCPPETTVKTGITFDGNWQDPDVNQANLNEIKALFEQYHPDIKVIEVRTSGINGKVGNTIKIAKGYVNSWAPANSVEAKELIDFMYGNPTTKAHDNGWHIYKSQFYS